MGYRWATPGSSHTAQSRECQTQYLTHPTPLTCNDTTETRPATTWSRAERDGPSRPHPRRPEGSPGGLGHPPDTDSVTIITIVGAQAKA